jgi:hypothetical protein
VSDDTSAASGAAPPAAAPNPYREPPAAAPSPSVDLRRKWQVGGVIAAVLAIVSVIIGLTIGSPKPDLVLVSATPFLVLEPPRPGSAEVQVSLAFVLELLNQREAPIKVDSVTLEAAPEEHKDRLCAATGPVKLEAPLGRELKLRDELYTTMRSATLYTAAGDDASKWPRPCLSLRWTATVAGTAMELTPTTQPDAEFRLAAQWSTIESVIRGDRFIRANVYDLLKMGTPGGPSSGAPGGSGTPPLTGLLPLTGSTAPGPGETAAAMATTAPATSAPATAVSGTTAAATTAPATAGP